MFSGLQRYRFAVLPFSLCATSLVLLAAGPVEAAIYVEGVAKNDAGVSTGTLGVINTQTGAITTIGKTTCGGSNVALYGIAQAPNGTIYGIDPSNNLYTVNATTGVLTKIGNTGVSATAENLAFTSNGTLYVSEYSSSGKSSLYTMNTTTAQATLQGQMGIGTVDALAGDASGNLYTAATNSLFKVNTGNGSASLLGYNNSGDPYGMTYTNGTMYTFQENGAIDITNLLNGTETQIATYNAATSFGIVYAATTAFSTSSNITNTPEPGVVAMLVSLGVTGVGVFKRRRPLR